MLEKILAKIEAHEQSEDGKLPTPEALGTDIRTPNQQGNAPVYSLFDNEVVRPHPFLPFAMQ